MASKHKTATLGAFMTWTKQVIRDPAAARGAPRRWYDSEATAAAAGPVTARSTSRSESTRGSGRRRG
jgi:hypothetical protein